MATLPAPPDTRESLILPCATTAVSAAPQQNSDQPRITFQIAAQGQSLRLCSAAVPKLTNRSKRTKKVGITGKYGVRYGSSLRRQCKKLEVQQHSKYDCSFCGKKTVKRGAAGIWTCKSCKKTVAGGAYTVSTAAAATIRSTIRRLRELAEA
ncbi:hypothetical protein KL930_002811 [Ogataea haglerorum]|uniref:60S ribosomal protein L43 n=1 Tax=Ogataea haglerorum TaxID=1937702 RepID=A0AAN6D7D1_9ASCO|nr:uncharacterized protein KL911_002931 [Ogataea haglerorum]KAG7691900.1 hypothetical protein KL915_004963 [Ogataea haglerorum]KAG7692666.1 hypothetical protein KL951_004913 [Ogataea haglerorum]KAG7702885.1 hypothetical protein KL950_004963 [Ogataea haglerorum]KAG7702983.1 hypothetical protein KL914_004988 [Ogataea haglerorum]KAG7718967.1 hypothetical protein KL913_001965 [Ogataea haglerorum]